MNYLKKKKKQKEFISAADAASRKISSFLDLYQVSHHQLLGPKEISFLFELCQENKLGLGLEVLTHSNSCQELHCCPGQKNDTCWPMPWKPWKRCQEKKAEGLLPWASFVLWVVLGCNFFNKHLHLIYRLWIFIFYVRK